MGRVRGKDTSPERVVRRLAHAMGCRFRLHRRDLPGCPDLVFPSKRKVVLVHGCYWHRHTCRRGRSTPRTNSAFWLAKFADNVKRDRLNKRALRRLGWETLVVWECETRPSARDDLAKKLRRFLEA